MFLQGVCDKSIFCCFFFFDESFIFSTFLPFLLKIKNVPLWLFLWKYRTNFLQTCFLFPPVLELRKFRCRPSLGNFGKYRNILCARNWWHFNWKRLSLSSTFFSKKLSLIIFRKVYMKIILSRIEAFETLILTRLWSYMLSFLFFSEPKWLAIPLISLDFLDVSSIY